MTNNEVFKKYENLVYDIAISRHCPNLFEDLIQEGYIALCQANKLYKRQHKKNAAKLVTYARVGIYRAMNRFIKNNFKHNAEDITDHFELRDKHIIGKEPESISEVKHPMTYVNRLSERNRYIIIRSFDLDGKGFKDKKTLGKELGITGQRVGMLYKRSINKLRILMRGEYAKNNAFRKCTKQKVKPNIRVQVKKVSTKSKLCAI